MLRGREIVDIGANIGNHSRYFLEYLDSSFIYSFEPDSNNFEFLKSNVNSSKSILHNIALGNEDKEVGLLNFNDYNCGQRVVVDGSGFRMMRLDDFSFKDIGLIKIDVEGYEVEVLRGGELTIKNHRPVIFMERNKEASDFLKLYGYSDGRSFEYDTVVTTEYIPDN
jgi:FkbM family methyltransferase